MTPFRSAAVARVFDGYPPAIRQQLLALRELIFRTAAATPGVGEIEETLKWSEPAYLTTITGSGSTVRIHRHKKAATEYAMYFNCQTTLVDTFRSMFADQLRFDGNRAVVFSESDDVPEAVVAFCLAAALTYHLQRRRRRKSGT